MYFYFSSSAGSAGLGWKITNCGGADTDEAGGFPDEEEVLGCIGLCERGILGGPLRPLLGVDLLGGAMRSDNGSDLGVDLLGGAIIIARGSFDAADGVPAGG